MYYFVIILPLFYDVEIKEHLTIIKWCLHRTGTINRYAIRWCKRDFKCHKAGFTYSRELGKSLWVPLGNLAVMWTGGHCSRSRKRPKIDPVVIIPCWNKHHSAVKTFHVYYDISCPRVFFSKFWILFEIKEWFTLNGHTNTGIVPNQQINQYKWMVYIKCKYLSTNIFKIVRVGTYGGMVRMVYKPITIYLK